MKTEKIPSVKVTVESSDRNLLNRVFFVVQDATRVNVPEEVEIVLIRRWKDKDEN